MHGGGFVFEDLGHGRSDGAQAAELQHLGCVLATHDGNADLVGNAAHEQRRQSLAGFRTEHGRAPADIEDEAAKFGRRAQHDVLDERDHFLRVLGALFGAQVRADPDLTDGQPISLRDEVVIALFQPHGLSKAPLDVHEKPYHLPVSSQSSTRAPGSFLPSILALAAGSAAKLVALSCAASTLHLSSKVWATSAETAAP